MAWLTDNLGTILVSLVLVAIVVLIVRKQIRDRLAGRTSCGCGCENCASRGICHGNPAEKASDPKDGKRA
ncbi:MAG: FeoB-associated Cys-rich membrane protein [Lachnospiraceae bacterium]|nr:FeoB-associated Cys-rich membrane protein [Lachnospiraceae bacterium]